jgi:hypothetical protein
MVDGILKQCDFVAEMTGVPIENRVWFCADLKDLLWQVTFKNCYVVTPRDREALSKIARKFRDAHEGLAALSPECRSILGEAFGLIAAQRPSFPKGVDSNLQTSKMLTDWWEAQKIMLEAFVMVTGRPIPKGRGHPKGATYPLLQSFLRELAELIAQHGGELPFSRNGYDVNDQSILLNRVLAALSPILPKFRTLSEAQIERALRISPRR